MFFHELSENPDILEATVEALSVKRDHCVGRVTKENCPVKIMIWPCLFRMEAGPSEMHGSCLSERVCAGGRRHNEHVGQTDSIQVK